MKPADIDKLICNFSMEVTPVTEKMLNLLAPYLFNKLYADGNIHTVPTDNQHYESKECWCNPLLSYKDEATGKEHYIHTDTRKEALN